MDFFMVWVYLAVLMRLTLERLSVFGAFEYETLRSSFVGFWLTSVSFLLVLSGVWRGMMFTWTIIYVVSWYIDPTSPLDAWLIRRSLR